MLNEFDYLAPDTREDLLKILWEYQMSAAILAGGTDILTNIRLDIASPKTLVDIKRIPDFRGIRFDAKKGLEIGAAVTINEILENADIKSHYPILADAAENLASHQLRNRATVVGNVVNASPCADMSPPLLCLDAAVHLASEEDTRVVPLHQFFTGVKTTDRRPGEIVEKISVPLTYANLPGGYYKLKRIRGHDLGVVGVALLRAKDELRFGISSAAPTPILVPGVDPGLPAADIVEKVKSSVSPITDVRCTREYREFMLGVYVERLLGETA
jgi:carbon-monoxide dehydrogenase medium subunit